MADQAENKMQTAEAKHGAGPADVDGHGVKFLGMKHLDIVRLKTDKEGTTSHHFTPGIGALPKEFLILPNVAWRTATEKDIGGGLRWYAAALRERGGPVEISVADSGVVRFDLTVDGEKRSLWFNAMTSDTVVLDADGNVCRNIREAIQDPSV